MNHCPVCLAWMEGQEIRYCGDLCRETASRRHASGDPIQTDEYLQARNRRGSEGRLVLSTKHLLTVLEALDASSSSAAKELAVRIRRAAY